MSYTQLRLVNFGAGQASLATVGYRLYNPDGTPNGARITAGVTERPAASGIYGAAVVFPDLFAGEIRWDTGGGSPVYASEDIEIVVVNVVSLAFPAGAIQYTYTITNSVTLLPIAGANVWFSTDLAGANIIWKGVTDAFGVARDVNNNKPMLNAGSYYVWVQFPNFAPAAEPTLVVVS